MNWCSSICSGAAWDGKAVPIRDRMRAATSTLPQRSSDTSHHRSTHDQLCAPPNSVAPSDSVPMPSPWACALVCGCPSCDCSVDHRNSVA